MDPVATLLAHETRGARERRVFGVVTALVLRIEDGGRYFLDYLGMADPGQESAPARVMAPMAGDSRGVHFLPERGDEVVVAFENGDTNLPIIIGAVWNRDSPPPTQAQQSESNDVRTIVSRSGHEITFDDTSGSEQVIVRSQGGHEVTLDDSTAAGKVQVRSANGHELTLDDAPPGQVELKSAGGCSVTMSDAGGRVTVEALTVLDLKAQVINVQGTAINLKTTGVVTTSTVMIDGKPFGVHMHTTCPVNPSGPVLP
jgi:phage baseplate assembly protein gpV